MGGGEQSNPAMDTLAQQQQQQQWKDIGNTLSSGFQRAGQSVAGANAGLSGQVSGGQQQPYGQAAAQGPYTAATGPLFSQGAAGAATAGISQEQLAQILRTLGYGG